MRRTALALVMGLAVAAGAAAAAQRPLGLDLYMPVPESNPFTAEKVALGRQLFADRRLSRDGTIACVSCHDPARAFSDDRPIAIGVFGRSGKRHAPSLINRAWGRSFFWDGRAATLEDQVLKPLEDPLEMDLPIADAATRAGVSMRDLSQALATYVRSILSGDSPYDRFLNGDRRALSPAQQEGLQIFRGKGNCIVCHVGPNLTDERLHNTGVAWRDGAFLDAGAGNGRFKTPTLREVARTAPYMHDGSFASLADVIEFYDRGGRANPFIDSELRPLQLTSSEKQAVAVFLAALSGTVTR